jgi:tRNA pseudouridine38-40 synthase
MDSPIRPPAALAAESSQDAGIDQRAPVILRRYKLVIAYDGSTFHGWQKQVPPEGEPLRTVAGVIEKALIRLLGQPLQLVGASRTDAGVHARGQVAHFDAVLRVPIERLAEALNSRLPKDIDIIRAELAAADFDAITDCRTKRYRYRILNCRRRPLELRHCRWHCWVPLDVQRMNAAAERLVGTHDVVGFAAASHGRSTTVRTISACSVELNDADGPQIDIVVEGDGFLYHMVRIIAGTLVEVGRGRFNPQVIDRILESCARSQAGPTLPPNGLWLEWIRY